MYKKIIKYICGEISRFKQAQGMVKLIDIEIFRDNQSGEEKF